MEAASDHDSAVTMEYCANCQGQLNDSQAACMFGHKVCASCADRLTTAARRPFFCKKCPIGQGFVGRRASSLRINGKLSVPTRPTSSISGFSGPIPPRRMSLTLHEVPNESNGTEEAASSGGKTLCSTCAKPIDVDCVFYCDTCHKQDLCGTCIARHHKGHDYVTDEIADAQSRQKAIEAVNLLSVDTNEIREKFLALVSLCFDDRCKQLKKSIKAIKNVKRSTMEDTNLTTVMLKKKVEELRRWDATAKGHNEMLMKWMNDQLALFDK
ncbi:hypothetical protein QR680_004261 [Steinernema hermaphroditum]|uniref:Uncharacterized protein n=1 Tax=Steinernema hermaphroditum TaxID=289476 RepID=A0AA39LTD6_9BILA|nr:hypothetical protein QR680_004261 [Steinernema hermaphroditum]